MIPMIAILSWPAWAIWLFSKLSFERAIIWSVLISFLFLPQSFAIDLPGVPALTKETLPNLMLVVMALVMAPRRFRFLPHNRIAAGLLLLLVFGAALTAQTNQDPILIADLVLPAMSQYDVLSFTTGRILDILPFLIGLQYLATAKAHQEILKAILAIGLAYSVLMLFEIRMSPQIHAWVYGYAPYSFGQQFRWGGFRPVVFMRSGLWTGFFAMTVMLAAAALWRATRQDPAARGSLHYLAAVGYMFVVLVLCKAAGSALYGVVFLPVVLFLKARAQIRIAAILALIALSYPILRGGQLVPTNTLLGWASSISAERAQSLRTRFDNEERLLAHANKRPLFGWGIWGRSRVYDQETGANASITDGFWVVIIGVGGWVSYIAIFGMLGMPILAVWRKIHRARDGPVTPATGVLTLLIGINMVELLPNSTLPPWAWLIAGALLGYAARTDIESLSDGSPQTSATMPRRTVI